MSHQEMYFRALCGVKESYDEASKSSVNSMKVPNVNVPAGYCIQGRIQDFKLGGRT